MRAWGVAFYLAVIFFFGRYSERNKPGMTMLKPRMNGFR